MSKTYIGTASIHGKEYSVSVVDGVPFLDGKTVDEFLATADMDIIRD